MSEPALCQSGGGGEGEGGEEKVPLGQEEHCHFAEERATRLSPIPLPLGSTERRPPPQASLRMGASPSPLVPPCAWLPLAELGGGLWGLLGYGVPMGPIHSCHNYFLNARCMRRSLQCWGRADWASTGQIGFLGPGSRGMERSSCSSSAEHLNTGLRSRSESVLGRGSSRPAPVSRGLTWPILSFLTSLVKGLHPAEIKGGGTQPVFLRSIQVWKKELVNYVFSVSSIERADWVLCGECARCAFTEHLL